MQTSNREYVMPKNSHDGQKVYTKLFLKFYNFAVLFFNNKFLWKCNTSNLLQNYKNNVSKNHLDIGVGTGFYLIKTQNLLEDISLMDLNDNCLDLVESKLSGKNVTKHKLDILKDIDKNLYDKYDSIAFNYLIHCLPDNGNKDAVFKNAAKMVKRSGVVFGSTIINEYSNSLAIKVANKFNEKGIFDNSNDSRKNIESYIKDNFNTYSLEQIGSVCVFSMSDPIR
jgi:2-polyprenyl-3-methyl-5-hydroxy-6-metoxy-1,4-benzoquinol methylase